MAILKRIRRFFVLTPRDLGMQTMTVSEIAAEMSSVEPIDESRLPTEFAKKVSRIMNRETSR